VAASNSRTAVARLLGRIRLLQTACCTCATRICSFVTMLRRSNRGLFPLLPTVTLLFRLPLDEIKSRDWTGKVYQKDI